MPQNPKDVGCPQCNAAPGCPCRYPSGRLFHGFHRARYSAADEPHPLLRVTCPTCGVEIGRKCVKPGTRQEISGIHTLRLGRRG